MQENLKTVVVATAFFLTGGCGLVYESLWTRYLSELTGGTALSQLIVLIVFMGGLALGAMLIGKLVDRKPGRGLFIYALLELGIGSYAILFPVLHRASTNLYSTLGANITGGDFRLMILKVVLSLMLIVIPSVAMGGTLPAVTRYLTKNHATIRARISLLYGINSLGAVLGILLAGFFLVYHYGMNASMQYTGAFNMLIGLTALLFDFTTRGAAGNRSKDTQANDLLEIPDQYTYTTPEIRLAIIVAGLSGFAAMALQVAWIRYFVIFLGATHSSFTIVVAAFICGIGAGSLLVRTRIVGRYRLPDVLLVLLLMTTTTFLLELFIYSRLPFETGRILGIFARLPFSWPFYSMTKFGIIFLVMLPITVSSGMILPVCISICERSARHIGRDVGRVYAVNTVASLLGILFAGQFLFRMLDLPTTLQVIMFIYLGTALFLTFALGVNANRKRFGVFLAVLFITNIAFWKPWSPTELFVYRINFSHNEPIFYKDFLDFIRQKTIIDNLHGPDAHVTVLESTKNNNDTYRSLFINGKPDAGTSGDMPVQIMTGHVPILLHSDPQDVFVLGLGSGITTGEVLKYRAVNQVTTVELAAEVFAASKSFADYNNRFWENARHTLIIDDGMNTLRLSREKFDVIILQPTNIWQAGMPGLFSEDFFKLVRSRLKPGGLAAQWMQTYLVDDRTVNLVLKTFSAIFPRASVFQFDENNILLIGYDNQWQFDPQDMIKRFNQPQIRKAQRKLGNISPEALLLREVVDRESFFQYTRVLPVPLNTLNFPVLEQSAEYGLFMQESSALVQTLDSRTNPDSHDMLIHEYIQETGLSSEQISNLIDSDIARNNPKLKNSIIFMLFEELWPKEQTSPPLDLLSSIQDAQLREIIRHPGYRKPPGQMTANEAYNLLGAELMIWYKAASQLWHPDPERLKQLYARIVTGTDQETAGKVARDAGFSLAIGGSCEMAIPFFAAAKATGSLTPESLTPQEMSVIFNCDVQAGDTEQATYWWETIRSRQISITPALQANKANLDILLGESAPSPENGRLPN